MGVTRGLAGIKLSGSPRRLGENITTSIKKNNITKNPNISFVVKYGWKGILSVSLFNPKGLFDPVW
jgi:hypothetical protein